jgi:hypothetical protein
MTNLVEPDGRIQWGLQPEPIRDVNALDYDLESPLGRRRSRFIKKWLFKQFLFIGIPGPDLVVGLAVVNLGYLTNGFLYAYDRASGRLLETSHLGLPGRHAGIDPRPDELRAHYQSSRLAIELDGGRLRAQTREVEIEAEILFRETPPLRIATRSGYRGWVFKQSTTPVPVRGQVRCQGQTWPLEPGRHQGLIDWSAGFMRRETWWNWAATAAVLPDGRTLGMNLSCGVNETSHTENYFMIDGRMTKVNLVDFLFDPRDPRQPWQVVSDDGRVDLTFVPEADRGERVNALLIQSRFTQMMGRFSGRLVDADGRALMVDNLVGWTEDHYAKW